MTPKRKHAVRLTEIAYTDLSRLPGNIRRQMIIAIDNLENKLRPHNSKRLSLQNENREIRRLRLGKWRIIYLIVDKTPVIVGIRKRPPYDYSDLDLLTRELE
jgi:mRNA-degrading endonuclease RelE of RelBE toxin-antitoxin system